jgi:signal peptidase II
MEVFRMKSKFLKYVFILFVMLAGCSSDFESKKLANTMKDGQSVTIIKNMMDLRLSENRGMIFGIQNGSMPKQTKVILIITRILILIALCYYIWINRGKPVYFLLPFLLIWSGALGNLIDQFIYGYVIDFIHIGYKGVLDWPFYFNLADAYVTIGIVLLFIMNMFQNRGTSNPVKPA